MAAYAYHAAVLGHEDDEVNLFFCEALFKSVMKRTQKHCFLSSQSRRDQFEVYGTLDKANTETYGTPEPTEVTLTVEKDHLL